MLSTIARRAMIPVLAAVIGLAVPAAVIDPLPIGPNEGFAGRQRSPDQCNYCRGLCWRGQKSYRSLGCRVYHDHLAGRLELICVVGRVWWPLFGFLGTLGASASPRSRIVFNDF
jgi:hypothetical protein